MKWTKSPPELLERFAAARPDDPRVVQRPMFGYPDLFLNGNMLAGTFQGPAYVRLGDADRRAAIDAGASPFEPMPGRTSKQYVVLPTSAVDDLHELTHWLAKARDHAAMLAPKVKPAKREAARGSARRK